MLSNTGVVSFVLYGIFIIIAIILVIIVIKAIKKGNLEPDKLDKIIEVTKYTILTIAITSVTLIIGDLFKEREQDLKELDYFDRYVQDVKVADNVLVRYQLSKYLATVAPNGELKNSWAAYYEEQKLEYKEYLSSIVKRKELDTVQVKTPAQKAETEALDMKIEQFQSPLVATTHSVKPRVYIQISQESQRDMAVSFQSILRNESFLAPGVENVGKRSTVFIPQKTEVRYYLEEDYQDALRLINILKANSTSISINEKPVQISGIGKRPRYFEIWFSNK